MIEIRSLNKSYNITRHFTNINDCNAYMRVFKDHRCNVKWSEPQIVPNDNFVEDVSLLRENPNKRAINDLSWGFNSNWKDEADAGLTNWNKFLMNTNTNKGEL